MYLDRCGIYSVFLPIVYGLIGQQELGEREIEASAGQRSSHDSRCIRYVFGNVRSGHEKDPAFSPHEEPGALVDGRDLNLLSCTVFGADGGGRRNVHDGREQLVPRRRRRGKAG